MHNDLHCLLPALYKGILAILSKKPTVNNCPPQPHLGHATLQELQLDPTGTHTQQRVLPAGPLQLGSGDAKMRHLIWPILQLVLAGVELEVAQCEACHQQYPRQFGQLVMHSRWEAASTHLKDLNQVFQLVVGPSGQSGGRTQFAKVVNHSSSTGQLILDLGSIQHNHMHHILFLSISCQPSCRCTWLSGLFRHR